MLEHQSRKCRLTAFEPFAKMLDEIGLTGGLSAAMAPTKHRRRGHDRGQVLVDVAVMIADGGDAISDLAVLRDQPDLFGGS